MPSPSEIFTAERVDPLTGYAERDVAWFREWVLPDFLKCRARLGLRGPFLDVGCGGGWFTREYTKALGWRVSGVDFLPERIAQARRLDPGGLYFAGDIAASEPLFSFDVFGSLVSSACFQHIDPSIRFSALFNLRYILKDEGYLICYDEEFETRPNRWDGFYEPLSREWLAEQPGWKLEACEEVALGLAGERIFRFEVKAVA